MALKYVKKKMHKKERNILGWNQAIRDAETRIHSLQNHIGEFRRAIENFKKLRAAGEPWLGQSATHS